VANLTITVDDEILKRARIRALEQGTSVNAILAEHLRAFVGKGEAQTRALASLLDLASENAVAGKRRAKQRGRRRWTREEIHERR
jgi:plasmid stability protein